MLRRLAIPTIVLLLLGPFSPVSLADKSLAELQKDCKHFDYKVRLAAITALRGR